MRSNYFLMGIDIGGTFTDAVVVDGEGRLHIFKLPTTQNPSEGFVDCLTRAAQFFGLSLNTFLSRLDKLAYGTTIATNALLQGKGAKTGLITTKGFRDTLPIARISREYLDFSLQVERPPSVTPRSLIGEVSERVDCTGSEITPLDMEDVEKAIKSLVEGKKIEALAICLLWSFKNTSHEQAIENFVRRKYPHLYVSLSSELCPIIGEYERTATVTMNARLGPLVRAQLGDLHTRLERNGLEVPLLIMQSIGGVIPSDDASNKPVTLLNSGPAGGLIASSFFSRLIDLPNLICIDMGGTSLDVSLVNEGQYSSGLVSRVAGHSIFVPMLDIHSIGAGGGSIAWMDMGRRLKVGPQSAGANPGPVCYDRGGTEPTVTDADVILGRINPAYFLGGEIQLDVKKAAAAIREKVAVALRVDEVEAAAGIVQIVDANMSNAIRVVTIQKGHDPRDYALIAFGGAGPTHAASLARELGIRSIIVPFLATAQSAFGVMASDIVHNLSLSDVMNLSETERINSRFQKLEHEGKRLLQKERLAEDAIEMRRYADMRYKGQSHEVTMSIPSKILDLKDMDELAERFEVKYQAIYGPGTAFRAAGFEVVTLRVDVVGKTAKPVFNKRPIADKDASTAKKTTRPVYFLEHKKFVKTNIYDGSKLVPGHEIEGPAIVEYAGTTAVIPPESVGKVDIYSNLVITL